MKPRLEPRIVAGGTQRFPPAVSLLTSSPLLARGDAGQRDQWRRSHRPLHLRQRAIGTVRNLARVDPDLNCAPTEWVRGDTQRRAFEPHRVSAIVIVIPSMLQLLQNASDARSPARTNR